jgi:hypothetical protein
MQDSESWKQNIRSDFDALVEETAAAIGEQLNEGK